MKIILRLLSCILVFTTCKPNDIPQFGIDVLNQEFQVALHDKVQIKSSPKPNNILGTIEFIHLDESRCPATAMCIRQGAAITTFKITTATSAEAQTVKLFIGDFMPGDPQKKRNRSADTVAVQLANEATYRLILKQVIPYPGTGEDISKATLVLQKE